MGVTSLNRSVSFPRASLVCVEEGSHVMDVNIIAFHAPIVNGIGAYYLS